MLIVSSMRLRLTSALLKVRRGRTLSSVYCWDSSGEDFRLLTEATYESCTAVWDFSEGSEEYLQDGEYREYLRSIETTGAVSLETTKLSGISNEQSTPEYRFRCFVLPFFRCELPHPTQPLIRLP